MSMLGVWSKAMNTLVEWIPYIESLFVLAMLGLGYRGYLSLSQEKKQDYQSIYRLKWIFLGLVGLALLLIVLFFWICFSQV